MRGQTRRDIPSVSEVARELDQRVDKGPDPGWYRRRHPQPQCVRCYDFLPSDRDDDVCAVCRREEGV